jgi:2-oxo-4-hydroxy-4-carboxy-5-ureidoimidazoline decarboxylase
LSELARFNDSAAQALRPQLLALTASPTWADALLDARPFGDLEELLHTSGEIITHLEPSQIDAALSGHPRIGESATDLDDESAARSAKEQAGMSGTDPSIQLGVARGNAAYENRFGRIYLVAAAGRSASELLSFLHDRLENEPDTELEVVRGELARITRLRLIDFVTTLDKRDPA